MTKSELEQWAIDVFWPAYKQLCKTPFPTKWTGGARGEAVKQVVRLNPSEELRNRIMDAIQAQISHRRHLYKICGSARSYEEETKYNKFYSNRDGRTWLYNNGWEDEIPSIREIKEQHGDPGRKCFCGAPTHGPMFNKCDFHLGFDENGKLIHPFAEELREQYRKMQIDPDKGRENFLLAKKLLGGKNDSFNR